MVDVFTRYIEAVPLKDQKAASLVREFENGWIYRGHGVPKGILSDQAPNIDGAEMRTMCDKLGIAKRHSSPYHPQADGLAERCIGLVKQVARCLTLDRILEKDAWPELLTEVTFYCNSMENSSTGFSAQLLHTGRQPTSPIDAWITSCKSKAPNTHQQYIEGLQELKKDLQDRARENDQRCKSRTQIRRNTGTRKLDINPGDYVLGRNERCSDSLDPRYNGPFLVVDSRDLISRLIERG